MVAAAAADGNLDADEHDQIRRQLSASDLGEEEQLFLSRLILRPSTIEELAADANTPELKAEVYAAARLTINPDSLVEQDWLDRLATALSLPDGLRSHLNAIGSSGDKSV